MYTFTIRCLILLAMIGNCFGSSLAPPLIEQAGIPDDNTTGAEILYNVQSVKVEEDLSWTNTEYFSVHINDISAARDYGRISISYNHYYSGLELEFANVLTPSGEIKSLKQDAIQQRVGGSQDFYEDRSELVFSLPEIQPGSIIEFQYQRKSKKIIMPGLYAASVTPYWYQPTVGGDSGRIDAVRSSEHRLIYPESLTLYKKKLGPLSPEFSSSSHGGLRTDLWKWRDAPMVPIEGSMEPIDNVMSRVRLSTMQDWGKVANWSWQLAVDKIKSQPDVAALAGTLVPDDATREQKIKAVYGYIQENIRYVFAHLGRGGYEPHFADEVLQQGYGDCKDQTILAIALLKELGIEAYPSLVVTPRNSRPDVSVVSLVFDHMIVYVPGPGSDNGLWMDTTADRGLYPGISNYLYNQSVLVVKKDEKLLTNVNIQLPENRISLHLDYYIDQSNRIKVNAAISMGGIYEQNSRSWWIHNTNRETSLEQMMENLFPEQASTMKMRTSVVNDKNLWEPMEIVAEFDFGEFGVDQEQLTYGTSISQFYKVFGNFYSLQIPRDRKSRWVNELTQIMEVTANFRGRPFEVPLVMSSGMDASNVFYQITQRGSRNGDSYHVSIHLEQPPLSLSTIEYQRYYEQLKNMGDSGAWVIRFAEDEYELEKETLADNGDTSLSALLVKTRFHLENGEFSEALIPAQNAVNLHAGSGEAWYLLGLAQGYNAQIDESIDSFSKASGLGYNP